MMTSMHDVTDEKHRESCEACTTLWAELEAISAEARELPLLTPSRDLWAGIDARIGGAASSPAHHKAWSRWTARPAVRLAAAATLSILDYLGEIDWSEFSSARDWYTRVKSRPAFRPLLADRVRGLSPVSHYADLDF